MTESNNQSYYSKLDTGYTKACPRCDKRYGCNPDNVGMPRLIEVEICEKCNGEDPQYFSKRVRF